MTNPDFEPQHNFRNWGIIRGSLRFLREPSVEPLIGGLFLLPASCQLLTTTRPQSDAAGPVGLMVILEVALLTHAVIRTMKNKH